MKIKDEGLSIGAVIIVIVCLCSIASLLLNFSYRQGQIDALNGKVRYKLVELEDKSVEWKRYKG